MFYYAIDHFFYVLYVFMKQTNSLSQIKVFSGGIFLYIVDMSESSNIKTTKLRKNEKKNGKLTTILIVVTLKGKVNLV